MTRIFILIIALILPACTQFQADSTLLQGYPTPKALITKKATKTPSPNNSILLPFTIQKQSEQASCGAATLASVFSYHGIKSKEVDLLAAYKMTTPAGYSVRELRDIARANDFQSFGIKGTLDIIKKELVNQRPVIAAVKKPKDPWGRSVIRPPKGLRYWVADALDAYLDHFWVIIGYGNKNLIIADPDTGIRTISEKHFIKFWTAKDKALIVLNPPKK